MVKTAYRKVKKNQGGAGVDGESLEEYQKDLQNNLYQLWNRLASGSYFPKPVRSVEIPKSNGKKRKLGIPTVSDRIAQQVIKSYIEPRLELEFSDHSYGYRPLKSAHQAISQVRENVREKAWVVDMDIKRFFDEVDHELLQKAIDRHVEENWVKIYIKRWLECSSQQSDGEQVQPQGKGTPQGGVISPILANLYLHYVLDKWMIINHPNIPFVRYADDVILHCETQEQAQFVLKSIQERMQNCKLQLNEEKTQVLHCLSYRSKRKKNMKRKFGFLGFTFQPKTSAAKSGKLFLGYDCSISQQAKSRIINEWKSAGFYRNSTMELQQIANQENPRIRGVMNYYGKFNYWTLRELFEHFNFRLAKWAVKKYKRFKGSMKKAFYWIRHIKSMFPNLFHHWRYFKYL